MSPITSSSRNKFQVCESLVVVNLQAKVAPSHIGENHLPGPEKMDWEDFISSHSEISKKRLKKKKRQTIYTQISV